MEMKKGMRKKERHLGVLTNRKIIEAGGFVGVTQGHVVIERFCSAVEAGAPPDVNDLKTLAGALEPLRFQAGRINRGASDNEHRDALLRFSCLLGLNKKQGRQKEGAGEAERMALPVVLYEIRRAELIDAGEALRNAAIKAKSEASEYAGIGVRAMGNRIRKYSGLANLLIRSFSAAAWKEILELESGK